MSARPPLPLSRRALLRGAVAAPLALLAACRRGVEAPASLSVPLAALAEGGRVRVLDGEEPIEVVRRGGEVIARSLWCTHLGCEVVWNGATESYDCPCHDGRFDAEGRVLGGPPGAPLRRVATRAAGDRVVLLRTGAVAGAS